MNIFQRILSWFLPLARYIFTCVLCGLAQIIEAETSDVAKAAALKQGWRGPKRPDEAPGWRCPACGK